MATEFVKNGTALTVRPEGRMDTTTSPVLDERIREEAEGILELTIDLEKVDYLSSGGLRILLAWHQEMEDRGGKLKLLNVNEYIKEVFEMTGFLDILTIE